MKKLSMILMLAFVCGSFAMAQTSNVSKKATLMPDGAVVTDIKTGEVQRTVKGGIPVSDLQISGTASITGGAAPSSGTPSRQTSPGSINTTPTSSGITTSSTAPAGGLQTIKTPGGSVTGNGGSSLINANNQGPIGQGSGVTQKNVDLTAPIPVNTNNQVSPQ